jgi:hypothetical protein
MLSLGFGSRSDRFHEILSGMTLSQHLIIRSHVTCLNDGTAFGKPLTCNKSVDLEMLVRFI